MVDWQWCITRKIQLGGTLSRIIGMVWFIPNHKPNPNLKTFMFNNNTHNHNTSLFSPICNKEGTLLKGMFNRFKIPMLDIKNLSNNISDPACINPYHFWQHWIFQTYLVSPTTQSITLGCGLKSHPSFRVTSLNSMGKQGKIHKPMWWNITCGVHPTH